MTSIFSKIVSGDIPAHKIDENHSFLAFLDIAPLALGHTLVIPKKEVDYIFDLQDDILADLHVFSKKVARQIEKAIPCERIGVSVIGLEVPHAHVHLIPMNSVEDMNFSRPKLQMTQQELADIAERIRKA